MSTYVYRSMNDVIGEMAYANAAECIQIFATLEPLWRAYAEACYDDMKSWKIRNLGEQGKVELALKFAEWNQNEARRVKLFQVKKAVEVQSENEGN